MTNPSVNWLRVFFSTFKRFIPAVRDQSTSSLSDIDAISGYEDKQFKAQLLEFPNVDSTTLHNLSAGQLGALRQLKRSVNGRHIVISKADKSRQICILDPKKYDQAVLPQLPDTNACLPIQFNLNNKCAALIGQCVRKFVKNKLLADKQAAVLLLYTGKPSTRCFYALPKNT